MSDNLPRKWADEAMFEAEKHTSRDPEVTLLWMTPDPLGAIAAMAEMYKGNVIRNMADLTDEQRQSAWDDVQRTHLKAPLEAVKLHFMIENVDRAFTHQMVRQRTAVYAQESMRFAVVEDLVGTGTSLPPSLHGTNPRDFSSRPSMAVPQQWRDVWDDALLHVQEAYSFLVEDGMPAEEARGLLPHATLTRLNYVTDLRALMDHAGNRLCTQAQFVWRIVFARIAEAIAEHGKPDGQELGPAETAYVQARWYKEEGWQQERIAQAFRPVCYQQGKCPFQASFDRHCSIRDRVEANAVHGRSSETWHLPMKTPAGEIVPGIAPEEWLADPGAARVS